MQRRDWSRGEGEKQRSKERKKKKDEVPGATVSTDFKNNKAAHETGKLYRTSFHMNSLTFVNADYNKQVF